MAILLALFLGMAGRASAQATVPGAYSPALEPENREETTPDLTERSYRDVYQMLLDRGLSEEAAQKLLKDYPIDKRFTPAEVDGILRRVRPEDLLTRRKKEEKAPEAEAPQLLPQPAGAEREPVPFGLEVFKRAPETFEPDQDLAVGGDYRLGPGDELRITLWGAVQQEFFPVVDREGNVSLPEVGVMPAAGLSLKAFEEQAATEFRKAFTGFKLSVSLRRLRRIQVVVAGEVVRPGAYFLSPVSTTFNALYFAGGPTPRGTLRRVRIVRDGQILAEVDLYQYLLEGNTAGDVRLLSGDTVFLLPKGPQVTVRGEVRRPAIFEILGRETVADAVRMAGGFTAIAYPARATLDRVSSATGPATVDLDLTGLLSGPAADTVPQLTLQDGDNLTVYSIYHLESRQFVEIQGMVQYPGIYPLYPGMRIDDLVFRAGGLLESAFRLKAELSRLAPGESVQTGDGVADSLSRVLYVDLQRALAEPEAPENLPLAKDDKLFIRKIPGWKLQETVKISGEVVFPGIYPLLMKEERLSQLVARAGGPTRESFLKGASLFRKDQGRVIINFEKALKDPGRREDIALVQGDSIHVPPYPPTILVEGEVSRPGALLYQPGKSAGYYVDRTGGITDNANRGATRIVRVDGVVQKAFRRFWWDPSIEPGSRVVVARKTPGRGINWGTTIKDATTVLASLATTVFILTELNK